MFLIVGVYSFVLFVRSSIAIISNFKLVCDSNPTEIAYKKIAGD